MSFDQVPFGESVEFAENTEPRCPCLLLLDTSGSMRGKPIDELNAGIRQFRDELFADEMAQKRVEVAIVGFGPVQVLAEFQTPDVFQPPALLASGDTPIGAAIEAGLNLLDQRKQTYRNNGVTYYRPWVFLITDGGPTDYWQGAAERVKQGEVSNHFSFFAVGVEGARMDVLSQITTREPLKLQELRFRDLFKWLSNSLTAVSKSQVGTQVPLENPTGPSGWGAVG
ncbi:vWA domain-containing protein [Terriglobus albidus]|uniref:vWA domain-containing protein n=1 Tax=Terriglobus albidus TaxID=1592106 RepID=UPI0021DF4E54|nr:VWA domain-containing protein [Terriglobus albidus]